jgi:endonuclease YncB( thermonuclease family)
MYEYHATILRHIDADTTRVTVDLGCDISINLTVRWFGINAPERNTEEGRRALEYVNSVLPVGSVCVLHTMKDRKEKYGRYLGIFYVNEDDAWSVNHQLIKMGYAVPYLDNVTVSQLL